MHSTQCHSSLAVIHRVGQVTFEMTIVLIVLNRLLLSFSYLSSLINHIFFFFIASFLPSFAQSLKSY